MDKLLKKIADELGVTLCLNDEPPGFTEWVDRMIEEGEEREEEEEENEA